MSEKTPSIEKLEKQLRVLKKKLERSEWHRVDLENQHDRDQHLYRRLHADLEAARREAEIEAALERVRSRAMAMRSSDELREMVLVILKEMKALAFPSGRCTIVLFDRETGDAQFWMSGLTNDALPERYHVPYHDLPTYKALHDGWRQGTPFFEIELSGEVKREQDRFFHEETEFSRLPEPAKEGMRRMDDLWLSNATTTHGVVQAVGTEPLPKENAAILQRFAKVIDLTYTRVEDIQQSEAQVREAQIEAALERIRAQSLQMQHSSELVATSAVFHEQLLGLGIPTEFSYVWLPEEAAGKHQFWATWTDEEDGEPVHRSRAVTYDLDTSEPYTAACFAAWESDDRMLVDFIPPRDVERFFGTWEELLGNADHLIPECFPDGLYYAEGYMQYGCFGINIRREPTEGEQEVLRRFSLEFERAYTRFLDLQRAEAQAREAQVEAALERVRARAMAMQSSDELLEVIFEIHRGFLGLGLPCEMFWHTHYTPDGYHKALTGVGGKKISAIMELPRDFSSVPALAAWERGDEKIGVFPFDADAACAYLHHMVTKGEFHEVDPEGITEEMVRENDGWTFVQARTSHGEIGYSLWGETEPCQEAKDVLVRFATTFDLAYRRFLDLKKAEAQAREGEIELALERVRARAMAMQKSPEISDVAHVLYQQLQHLGGELWGTGFAFCSPASDADEFWFVNQGGILPTVTIPNTEDPVHVNLYEGWKNGLELYTEEKGGEELAAHYEYLLSVPDVRPLFEGILASGLSFPTWQKWHAAYFSHGYLLVITVEPYEDEPIFIRFAKVFDQAYTRFLDLQKAEEQAREAQIEAALEKVRSRTMAMRKPDELQEVVTVVAEKLQGLGVIMDAGGVIICTYFPDSKDVVHWLASSDFSSSKPYLLPYFDHRIFEEAWHSRESGEEFFSKAYAIDEKNSFFLHAFEYSDYRYFPDDYKEWVLAAEHHALTFAWSPNAAILIPSFTDIFPSENDKDILKRFARVFEQAYIRFLDLQQAEEQAREAERQAALDRVRAEIASMRTAADLERITPLVWRELTTLGVPFFRCGVFIIDEATETTIVFLTTPEGRALAAIPLGFTEAPVVAGVVAHWRQHRVYTEQWEASDMQAWTDFLQARGLIEASTRYLDAEEPPEHLALHFVPFKQGMLYVGSTALLEADALDAVQALADAFAVAYARYEDFQRLEAKKQEVEAALADLQAAQQQLVHAEKMASLGALTAGIAHEIKNPLNFINNFAELNQELAQELTDELASFQAHLPEDAVEGFKDALSYMQTNAAQIAKHGRRADDIVRSMMQHAREGSGIKEPTAINGLVEEYVNLAYHGRRASQPGFNVDLQQDLDEAAGVVTMVPQDVGRVVLNLLGNAFDAVYECARNSTVPYAPTVTITTRREGRQVAIRVADNGPGIPAEVQAQIFEPFFTTKPTGSGTGLGLSLSYDIITQGHGGTLAVESTEGEGATFIITLLDRAAAA